MSIKILGLNHHNATLDYREKLTFTKQETRSAINKIIANENIEGVVILSTCNRTEIYLSCNDEGFEYVNAWLNKFKQIDNMTEKLLFSIKNEAAIGHLSRVACGLDSMILGEPQILGQLKDAYQLSMDLGALDKNFIKIFSHIFYVAKKVRSNTNIGNSPVSVAYAAVVLANQFFSRLNNHTALLIGAGSSIELVAKHLSNKEIGKLFIANRNIEKAQKLANKYNGYAIDIANLDGVLEISDMILSATTSENPILMKSQLEYAIKRRRRKPIFAVDMAVPRDLDPMIQELEDVYLYTIDDLQKVVIEGQNKRKLAANQADLIIEEQTAKYLNQLKGDKIDRTIIKLRSHAESIRKEVLDQSKKKIKKGDNIESILEQNSINLIKKILHEPSVKLKEAAENSDEVFIENISKLFDLNKE
jgi:glutamyl-tRNA reductase